MIDAPTIDPYPAHTAMKAIPEGDRDLIGDFVCWLEDHDYGIIHFTGGDGDDVQIMSPQRWIAEFFGLDVAAISAEKEQMLKEIRHQNTAHDLVKVRDRLKGRADGNG